MPSSSHRLLNWAWLCALQLLPPCVALEAPVPIPAAHILLLSYHEVTNVLFKPRRIWHRPGLGLLCSSEGEPGAHWEAEVGALLRMLHLGARQQGPQGGAHGLGGRVHG